MSWNDENVEKLKEYWKDGLSASQIAEKIGGMTRNAVIGKIHRLGLNGRTYVHTKRKTRERAKPEKAEPRRMMTNVYRTPTPPRLARLPPVPPDPAKDIPRKTLLELGERDCRWPVGDPLKPGFGFCGDHAVPGRPYCEHHQKRAYGYAAPETKTPPAVAPAEASAKPQAKNREVAKAQ